MSYLPWILHTAGWIILGGVGMSFVLNLLFEDPTTESFWGGVLLFGTIIFGIRLLGF